MVSDGKFHNGEFQVPRAGDAQCPIGTVGECPGDGAWGAADVKAQTKIVFAGSDVYSQFITVPTKTFASLWLFDINNHSVPTGSTLSVTSAGTLPLGCNLPIVAPDTIPNTIFPNKVTLNYDASCSGATWLLKVTTPLKQSTTISIPAP
jgi:hypothetical protein